MGSAEFARKYGNVSLYHYSLDDVRNPGDTFEYLCPAGEYANYIKSVKWAALMMCHKEKPKLKITT